MSKPVKKALVPELRFPEFRDEWNSVELSKCFKNTGGTALEKYVTDEGTHHFISIGNYSTEGKYIDKGQRIEANDVTKTKLLNKNDLVMVLNDKTLAGDIIGSTLLIDEDNKYIYNQRSERLIIDSELMPVFSWFLLNSQVFRKEVYKRSQGGTQIYVNFPSIKAIKLTIPKDQKEQQKIADCLSSLDALITAHTQKHEALKAHKKGLMQQLFPAEGETVPTLRFPEFRDAGEWEDKNFYSLLEEIIDFRGRTPKKLGMDWGGGNIVSLSANNVKNGYIDFDAECNLGSLALYEKWMDKVDLKKNDIVFTMEAPLGKALLVPDSQKYILSQRVVAFKTKKNIKNAFLIQLIWSPLFQNLIKLLSTGSTAKGINQKTLKTVHVRIPREKKEQQKIADFLSSIDELITAQSQKIEALKTHKKGLMQQLFPTIDDDHMDAKADTVLPKELSHG